MTTDDWTCVCFGSRCKTLKRGVTGHYLSVMVAERSRPGTVMVTAQPLQKIGEFTAGLSLEGGDSKGGLHSRMLLAISVLLDASSLELSRSRNSRVRNSWLRM